MRPLVTKSTEQLSKSGSSGNLGKVADSAAQAAKTVTDKPAAAEVKKTASDVDLFSQSNASVTVKKEVPSGARLPPPRPTRPSGSKPFTSSAKKLPDGNSEVGSSSSSPLSQQVAQADSQSDSKVDVKADVKTDVPEVKPEVEADQMQGAKSQAEARPEAKDELKSDSKQEVRVEIKVEGKDEYPVKFDQDITMIDDGSKPTKEQTQTSHITQQTQVSEMSAVTMADTNDAPQRVDMSTGEPSEVDPALMSPKFEFKQEPAAQLLSVLKFDNRRMSAAQKEAYRLYLTDFIAAYQPKDKFADIKELHYNTQLLDQCFECIADDKNFAVDKILNILVLLSRYSKSVNNGLEPRVTKIFDLLKQSMSPSDIIKEAVKALINYAEGNAKTISSGSYIDILMSHYSARLSDADFILNMLKVLRNLTVPEFCRKPVLEKLGFLVVNSINQHGKDKNVVENACWLLGNCAVSSESVTYFVSLGTFQALKSTMVTHTDQEKVIEACLWVLFNVTYDQGSSKIILKSLLEENIIDAIKKFGQKNNNIYSWSDLVLKRLRAALQVQSPHAVAERIASQSLLEDYVMVQTGQVEDYVFQRYNKRYMVMLPGVLIFTDKESDQEILMEVRFKDVVDVSTYPPQVKESVVVEEKKPDPVSAKPESSLSPQTPLVPDAVLDQELPLSYSQPTTETFDAPSKDISPPVTKTTAFPVEPADVKLDTKTPSPEPTNNDSPWPQRDAIKIMPKLQVQLTKPVKAHVKQIKITTRQRVLILQGKTADFNLADVLIQVKSCWKAAVSAVTENAASSEPKMSPTSFTFSVPETILAKDLEKACFAHVIHEIYCNPFYVTYKFKCQSKFPEVAVWDFVVVKLTKKISLEFIDKHADQYKTERGVYDAVPLRAQLAQIVDDTLMAEVEAFEAHPNVGDAPLVSTMYEYCAKQGIRPTMEDRHIHLPYIDYLMSRDNQSNPSQYYAVYDGHGGTHVASFVETYLHYNLMKHPLLETDIKKALYESFMKTQDELKQASDRLYLPTTAGSTAVVLYFTDKKMYCAWAGDSLASLYRKKEIIELVDPHKPSKDSEKARIEKLGGFVAMEGQILRVNGVVAVSRAFGNIRHRVILPECDIKEIDLNGEEEYIVLACDGLWDVMTPPQVKQFVTKYMKKHGNKTAGMSEALVDESLRLGSTDNVSVVFIEFRDWKLPKRS